MTYRSDNVIRLQTHPDGAIAEVRSSLDKGRFEVTANGPNPEFDYIGSDPWNTHSYTGLVVPPTPSAANGGARYLFLLARASFGSGEQNPALQGVRLVGIRQYAEIVARLPARVTPLAASGPPTGATVTFRRQIDDAIWHPPDGNISWHVMVIPRTQRDTRNPVNSDGFMFQDARTPALLYQTGVPSGVNYTPPNGGRPWGRPIGASLGNIHELRYKWRTDNVEQSLNIPISTPCDIALYASVRQNDPATNPTLLADGTDRQFTALSNEDKFLTAYSTVAQYGTIAGALVFSQSVSEDIP